MKPVQIKLCLLLVIWTVSVNADFDCACNYNVEKAVYPSPDLQGQPIGYLYEFDCKAISDVHGLSNRFFAIQFERKLGYVEIDNQLQRQTCGGDPSPTDLIPQTTQHHGTPPTTLPHIVSGQWSDWQEWARCETSCGDGTRSRTRSCDNPPPSNGGQPCSGDDKQSKQCDNGPCPIDGEWSGWQTWSKCSVSCEAGTRARNRTCDNPTPEFDGSPCQGVSSESGSCNNGPCPINGLWSAWQTWSKCSVSCSDGTQTRTRACNNPSPANGGQNCVGAPSENSACNEGPCPVDGLWTTWASWSQCSMTCGAGTHARKRECAYQTGSIHGRTCIGASTESGTCDQGQCPVDGLWASWAAWTKCSVTCAQGTRLRNRTCTHPAPAHGGSNCVGVPTDSGSCDAGLCPVDGQWASWQAWTKCSVTCAKGSRSRNRTCTHPAPAHGGSDCVGVTTDSGSCDTGPCPVDGLWASWAAWTKCSVTCAQGARSRNRTCTHPAPAHGGSNCVGVPTDSGPCDAGLCPVDGQWASWTSWTKCSVTCAKGTRFRNRTCTHPAPAHGGSDCVGVPTDSGSCDAGPCPVDGLWASWQAWATCSVTCAKGSRSRNRTCTHPAPAHGGANCVGVPTNSGSCDAGPCPVDGHWSSWQVWSACSVTCAAGTRTRNRTCNNPAPAHGGSKCVGTAINSGSCNPGSCPVDGKWASWTSWTKCSVTCAKGIRSRNRTCTHPAPAHGGSNCVGVHTDSGSCDTGPCPVDGHWSSWQVWSACSVTCAAGTRSRNRTCNNPAPAHGGSKCVGTAINSGSCNPGSCPVDGKWASWTSWTKCSVTCAKGTRSRNRTCTHPAPAHGGSNCAGVSTDSGSCDTGPCPVDGQWASWATWTKCSVTCAKGTRSRNRTCSHPAPAHGGSNCVGVHTNSGSCDAGPCPVDGHWSSWLVWSACSVTCASGTRTRNRTCNNPAPAHGGSKCVGTAINSGSCNPGPCPVDGHWSSWLVWSACSVTCAAGTRTRNRTCTNPAPAHGGSKCVGTAINPSSCNPGPCPVDGQWASWATWSTCSVTCAKGTRSRNRTCTHPAPAHGGSKCVGVPTNAGSCNPGPCPVNGHWGSWSSYGACSVTCESGHRTRTRKCNHPAPAYGGHNCPGSSSSQISCHLSACIVNVTGTPYQFVGVGYNLLTGNPETTDPGLLSTHRIFQLTGSTASVREVTYEKHSTCTPTKTTVLLHGSKAYQDELKNLIRPDESHNNHILAAAFTYNSHFETMRNNLDNKDAVYLDRVTTCALGSLKYNTGGSSGVSGSFAVSQEFAKALCALPVDLSASSSPKYMHFLDTWGTSVVTSIDVGTKTTERYTATPAQVYQHVQNTDPNLFELSGQFQGYNSSVVINTHDYTNSHAVTGSFGRKNTSNLGTSQKLVPVGGEVIPITDALNSKYWQTVIDGFVKDGVCPSSIKGDGLQNYADSLHMALGQYSSYKDSQTGYNYSNTQLLDRHNIQVPVSWPLGTYGLMQPVSGCPDGHVAWHTGYVIQDTEDSTHHNAFSPSIGTVLKGRFLSTSIRTEFCIKTSIHSITGSQYDHNWSSGKYCILKKGTCPSGLSEGYIYWDDENTNNGNTHSGTLPDGIFNTNTRINYCCRHDGDVHSPMLLPTVKPFILLRYGTTCQAVRGMASRQLYIQWDDQSVSNKDTFGGVHPMDDGGTGDHKLHFCYYIPVVAAAPAFIG